jgi:hypothetical protein
MNKILIYETSYVNTQKLLEHLYFELNVTKEFMKNVDTKEVSRFHYLQGKENSIMQTIRFIKNL